MRAMARVLILAALVFGSGCARTDWIERTLVTVDVTGTWTGSLIGGANTSATLSFELEQQGSTVKGFMRFVSGGDKGGIPVRSRPIDGTVAGDVFRFRAQGSTWDGQLSVSGDEMTGQVSVGGAGSVTLRRVDPSSRPPR
jgi:hypothetical protein